MIVKINDEAVTVIEAILKRGNKAVVQRKGRSFIILEEKRKQKYDADPVGDRKRAI